MRNYLLYFFTLLYGISCRRETVKPQASYTEDYVAAALQALGPVDSAALVTYRDTGAAARLVSFAKLQLGTPYKYCSMTPEGGFDCSGFINYVFNHFGIIVPRSSVEFTNIGVEIPLNDCRPGDLILFTGTNPSVRTVGHIGLITDNGGGTIHFIQSTSGAEYGVVISPLNDSYMKRFVKVIRIALVSEK